MYTGKQYILYVHSKGPHTAKFILKLQEKMAMLKFEPLLPLALTKNGSEIQYFVSGSTSPL
jgi:hypothetical protein